jgi:hypothetical protein
VIEDAELGVKKEPADKVRLRERYARYVKFGFAQVMFLPQSNAGVCYSFTVHWARRILMGKTYFGMSNKTDIEARPSEFDRAQKARIMKKVDRHIRPLQAELQGWEIHQFGDTLMTVAAPRVDDEGETPSRFAKYGNMFVLGVGEPQPIGADARGSQFMGAVLDRARAERQQYTIFIVSFSKGQGGHGIGIHLEGALHFFDPNFGEFAFPDGSEADLRSFLDDWWQAFYMVRGRRGLVQHWERGASRA